MQETFIDYASGELYRHVSKLGDRLDKVRAIIDLEKFRPILKGMYNNQTEKGRRPNIDEILMLKVLVLQN